MTRGNPLSGTRQCELLEFSRSTFYRVPAAVSDAELALMRLIDQCHTELTFYGSRRIVTWLEDEGVINNPDLREQLDVALSSPQQA